METKDILPIYINCWKKDTFYKIILHICEKLGYTWVHNKKSDELFKEACKLMNKKKMVFCFDEVDKLEDQSILYQILEDVHKKSIFLITNEKDWLAKLDQRVRSRMIPEIVEFEPYNYDETKGILEQRKSAFVEGILAEESFEKIVDKTTEMGDIRTGLFLLRESGNAAELKSSRQINLEHTEKALTKLEESFKIRNKDDLSEEDNYILKLVKENPETNLIKIYEEYKQLYDKSYRTLQRKVKDLEKAGLVTIKEETTKQGGKTSSFSLASKKLTDF